MAQLVKAVKKFLADEKGPMMAEYPLMVALIAVVSLVAIFKFGRELKDVYEEAGDILEKMVG